MTALSFLPYLALAAGVLLALWLLRRYGQERQYRRRPYVAPSHRSWAQHLPDPALTPLHRVALLGDPGAVATEGSDPILQLLADWQHATGPAGTIIILGDNVYPTGLPAPDSPGRPAAEKRLDTLLAALRQFPGRVVFLSGNHDWNKGRPDGYAYLLRQEAYIAEHLPASFYLPPGGVPGPVSMQLAEDVLLVALNTQWWVQHGARPAADPKEPFRQLHHLLAANRHQRVLVVGHHPLYSNALHGGKFTAKQHVFPLTTVHKRAYVPLPLVGSLLPLYRKLVGAEEDMAHPRYRRMRRRLLRVLRQFPNIIYAAGHDHNLQYFSRYGGHYLVSGAGSKTAFVQQGGNATFVHEHKGFFSVDFYSNGEAWLRTLEPTTSPDTPEVFRQRLLPGPVIASPGATALVNATATPS